MKTYNIEEKTYNLDDMTSFTKFFRMVLSKKYLEESREVYAYYEKKAGLFISQPKIAVSHPISFKLYCGYLVFEAIVVAEEEVQIFEVLYDPNGSEIKLMTKSAFIEEKEFLLDNKGFKDNGWKVPKSEIYISNNAVSFLYANKSNNLINHHLLDSGFLKQLEDIYQLTARKKYIVTPQTTVKEFYRDIIEALYPDMSEHYKTIFCKIFKGEN